MRLGTMNHLRLSVKDVPEAERFYDPLLKFLGYQLVQRSPDRLAWAMPGPDEHLQWFIVSEAAEHFRERTHDMLAPGLHHFAFNVESRGQVDAFHELLVRNEVDVLKPPDEYDYEPNYYAVFFTDPNGFKLEVVHIPQPTPVRSVTEEEPAAP